MSRPILHCDSCGTDVIGLENAVVHIKQKTIRQITETREAEVMKRRLKKESRVDLSDDRRVILERLDKIYELDPPEARWEVHCVECNPHWNQGGTAICEECFSITCDQLTTWQSVARLTQSLMRDRSKWLYFSNWDRVLEKMV